MMNLVILITGQVKFQINLDPSIWIFDERRFQLSDRLEGTEGTAIEFKPFLEHAEPDPLANKLICHRREAEPVTISMSEAKKSFLCFAIDNQPLGEQGPVLLYFADGSNKENPIGRIKKFEVIS